MTILGSKVANILKTVAPIAASFIPGIGPLAAAGIGAGIGALGGGGLKGALLGGITSGAGNYLGAGNALSSLGSSGSSGLSSAATKLAGSGGGMLSGAMSPGIGAGLSSFAKPAADLFGAYKASEAQDDTEKRLLEAQGRSEAALSPFLANGTAANQQLSNNLTEGFNPGDLTQDPGYQFNLNQGMDAMNKKQAATGNYYSGAALKEAQTFGQGLADNTYNNAYQRWAQQNGQLAGLAGSGQNAANAMTDVYDNEGNIGANATVSKSNILQKSLSSLLSGNGALGDYSTEAMNVGRKILGYKSDGSPIYGSN